MAGPRQVEARGKRPTRTRDDVRIPGHAATAGAVDVDKAKLEEPTIQTVSRATESAKRQLGQEPGQIVVQTSAPTSRNRRSDGSDFVYKGPQNGYEVEEESNEQPNNSPEVNSRRIRKASKEPDGEGSEQEEAETTQGKEPQSDDRVYFVRVGRKKDEDTPATIGQYSPAKVVIMAKIDPAKSKVSYFRDRKSVV